MKIIDLFSGIGGFSLGFKNAGYEFTEHYFSEIDKHAIANYKYNFKDAKYIGDIRNVDGREFKDIDIITFGSPCQNLSSIGKREGLDGEQSRLFYEAVRVISEVRPRVFIWENVKGALSSNSGEDFAAVLQTLHDIGGYRLEWQLLNTRWFLPQNRERVYLVGHLAERSKGGGVFPIGEDRSICSKKNREVYDCARTLVKRYRKSSTVGSFVKHKDGRIRYLTENEAERLQGFPDDWTKYGNYDGAVKEILSTHRYDLAGNAVTVKVVEEIAKRLNL